MGSYHNDFTPNRSSLPQHLPGNLQSSRGVRSSYSQRSSPSFRTSSSYLRHGHVGSSDDASQLFAEGYSSRHSRPLSTLGPRSSDRNGRTRISSDRYRSLAGEAGFREQLASEVCILILYKKLSCRPFEGLSSCVDSLYKYTLFFCHQDMHLVVLLHATRMSPSFFFFFFYK